MIDSAARLDPLDISSANRAGKVADLEAAVHAHALGFPTVPTIDQLPALLREGYPQDAARHATQTMLSLAPECALPVLLDRAEEVADAIGTAGRSDTEDLRDVLRHARHVAG